jgi:uncharacterized protein (DUF608 family)
MSEARKNSRRSFLQKVGAGSLGATFLPLPSALAENESLPEKSISGSAKIKSSHEFNESYSGEYLSRVAFPLGGMGTGMYCIEGAGAFSHMSIRHKPDVFNEPGMFAAIAVKGMQDGAKVLEGPAPGWKKFGRADAGNGSGGTIFGLPRFDEAICKTRFPFAGIELRDSAFPLSGRIEAWSSFVPRNADHSSLPAAALTYTLKNNSSKTVEAVFSFHSKNFLRKENEGAANKIGTTPNGFILNQEASPAKNFLQADFAIFTDQDNTVVDHCWFRGGWFDSLTMTWQTVQKAQVKSVEPVSSDAPGASLYVPFNLEAGKEKSIIVFTCWYIPYTDIRFGDDVESEADCDPESGCCATTDRLGEKTAGKDYEKGNYQPWYASRFRNIAEVVAFWKKEYQSLKKDTEKFTEAFYASTLPPEVVEAVAANLSILKSPTVLRQLDGRLWNFEGCGDTWGCCHGSCTHVWNYAQAIPHLFPQLERTLRHTEYCESQNKAGHQNFRASLPIRPLKHEFHAAADGQLGGIMKVYREWRISADHEWLKKMYPLVKASMDYCQRTWDPRKKGIVEEPHHNTYDIEFWGPDGMCTSFYVSALLAMREMAGFLKKKKDRDYYHKLYDSGRKALEFDLFDGEYFIQKIQTRGLHADPIEAAKKSMVGNYSSEAQALMEKEGPKYQYGSGCLSDGILGAWIARMCGLPDPIDSAKIASHLKAVHKYNFRKNLADHSNPQRPSFAFGDDGGLLLCSWPKGGMLSLPFVYSNEVWTGIEYQVASHLMLMGQVNEGLEIVRECRRRYSGKERNPFNEYECGHWYARALSSYGLMQGLTGLRFDAVDKLLYVDSRIGDFTSFLSTEAGFGNVTYKDGKVSLNIVDGKIDVQKVNVGGKVIAFTPS